MCQVESKKIQELNFFLILVFYLRLRLSMKHVLASACAGVCWRPGPAGFLTVLAVGRTASQVAAGPHALGGADPTQLLPDGIDDLVLHFVELSNHLLQDLLFHPV